MLPLFDIGRAIPTTLQCSGTESFGRYRERDTTVLESLLILLGLLGIVISIAVKLLCLPSKPDNRQQRRRR